MRTDSRQEKMQLKRVLFWGGGKTMPPRAEEKNRVLADRSISNCDIMCKNLKSYTLLTDKIGVKSWQSC